MQTDSRWVLGLKSPPEAGGASCCVGQLVDMTQQGRPVVDFPGNPLGPLNARALVGSIPTPTPHLGMPVLLVFDNGDSAKPIIIGFLQDTVAVAPAPNNRKPLDAVVDGRRVRLEANEEILLQTGNSSILLRKDGKIIIKGMSIVSRASTTNKVRGCSVSIN